MVIAGLTENAIVTGRALVRIVIFATQISMLENVSSSVTW